VSPHQYFCSVCGTSLDRPSKIGGEADGEAERRFVTVMFCDLVGSSAITVQLGPEGFASLLVAYRQRCAPIVTRYGGYISRYLGDGVLACFGYPRASGRDAQSAVACGLELAREIDVLNSQMSLDSGSALAVRIGIDTGDVIAGRLGTDEVMELDALVGTAPNTAARLQALAKPNCVVIGEATYDLVCDDYVCLELEPEKLRGLQPAGRAFEVVGEIDRHSRKLTLAKRRVRLVGRSAELTAVLERWRRCAKGRGQTILLSGEPGIGKSRLAQELVDHIANDPHTTIAMTCTPHAAGTAFYPIVEALREELRSAVEQRQSEVTMNQVLADLVEMIGLGGASGGFALLANALGLSSEPSGLEPSSQRALLLKAFQAWLLHRASELPLLIIVEDLHWSDPSSIELLRELSDMLPSLPTLLLLTYRTDLLLPWPDHANTLRMTLPPLERTDAEQLVEALIGDQASETKEAILTRSDGIPLFLEEFALAASKLTLPPTLQQLFTSRLDALGNGKRLAQCASILAPLLERDLLAALSDLSMSAVDETLSRLVDMEVFIRVGGASHGAGYRFRHALIQQAAHDTIMAPNRRAMHARAAALLTRLRPRLVEQQPETLAEHFLSGGVFASAAPLFALAARRALAAAALEEAEGQVRKGLAAIDALPSGAVAHAELDLRVLLGHVLIARRGYASEAVQEAFETALAAAETVSEESEVLPALRGLASFYQVRGPLSRAQIICSRLVSAAEKSSDPCLLVEAWRRRGWNSSCMGRLAAGEQDLVRTLTAVDHLRIKEHVDTSGHDPRVLALANLCWFALPRYGAAAAETSALAAASAASDSIHPVSACYGLVFAALVLQQVGQLELALQFNQRAKTIAADKGFAYWVALSTVAAGNDEVIRRRDIAAGRDAIEAGLASYRETQGELLRPFILSLLAAADSALGRKDVAIETMGEAIDVAKTLEAYGFLPELQLQRARLAKAGSADQHKSFLREALATCQRLGASAAALTVSSELDDC
jgi:class 3 adenylate cyclase/tetratricopeptide (TPR) repeat protein